MRDFPRSLTKGDKITYRIYGETYYGVVTGPSGKGYLTDLYSEDGTEYLNHTILPSAGGTLTPSANLYDLEPIT